MREKKQRKIKLPADEGTSPETFLYNTLQFTQSVSIHTFTLSQDIWTSSSSPTGQTSGNIAIPTINYYNCKLLSNPTKY